MSTKVFNARIEWQKAEEHARRAATRVHATARAAEDKNDPWSSAKRNNDPEYRAAVATYHEALHSAAAARTRYNQALARHNFGHDKE